MNGFFRLSERQTHEKSTSMGLEWTVPQRITVMCGVHIASGIRTSACYTASTEPLIYLQCYTSPCGKKTLLEIGNSNFQS